MKPYPLFLQLVAVVVLSLAVQICQAAGPERFVPSGEGTVIDKQTGLMWAISDNGADIDWEGAKAFCENYGQGGYTDWRLPTLKELSTIYDSDSTERFKAFAPIHLSGCCPWTSDTRRNRARTIFFMVGEINTFPMSSSSSFRALPVRTAQ